MDLVLARHSNRADLLLSVLMSALAAFTGWALLADVSIFVRDEAALSERQLAGTVATAERTVRRRAADLPLWDGAAVGDELRLRDHVFTDEGANATLALVDGTTLELGENTLIAMETAEDRPVLNVIKGSIRARVAPAATPVLIKVAGKDTLIRSDAKADVSIKVRENAAAEITVWSGTTVVGAQKIGPMEAVAMTQANEKVAPVRTVGIKLASPDQGARFRGQGGIELSWSAMKAASIPVTVEIARDEAFAEIIHSASLSSGSTHTFTPSAFGTHYWRIRPTDTDAAIEQVYEERRFTVAPPAIPRLIAPVEDQAFQTGDDAASDVQFAWTSEDQSTKVPFVLEVGLDDEFKTRTLSETSPSPFFRTSNLRPGSYYWRVRGEDGWSQVARFSVAAKPLELPPQPAPTPAPKLKAPSLPKRMEILIPWRAPSTRGPTIWQRVSHVLAVLESTAYAGEQSPLVQWEAVDGAAAYEVEVASDQIFQTVVLKKRVNLPQVDVSSLPPGTYYLRLATVDAAGVVSEPSEASTLVIAKRAEPAPPQPSVMEPEPLRAPTLLAPMDGVDLKLEGLMPVVSFAWRPVAKAATYVVQVRDQRGEVVFEKRTRGQDANAELKAGPYSWRVQALRTRDDADGTWSKAVRFSVTHVVPAQPVTPSPEMKDVEPQKTAEPEPSKPQDAPLAELHILHAPSIYRYEATEADPETRIKATLLNSFRLQGSYWLSPEIAVTIDGDRTSTKIFEGKDEDVPAEQAPIEIKPYGMAGGLRLRIFGDSSSFLDARLAYVQRRFALFERTPATTLVGTSKIARGPTAAVEAGATLDHLQLRSRLDWAHVSDGESSGTLSTGSMLIGIPTGLKGTSIDLGYLTQLDRMDEVRITTHALLWGLAVGL